MADVKLHRCGSLWIKGPHACWRVQRALDEAGIPYELVTHPTFPRSRRRELEALTGQRMLPVVELADGTFVREDSRVLAARIRERGERALTPSAER
jgi:glutathione S-transferase